MKTLKKILVLLMIAVFIFAPTIQASNSTYVYQSGNMEIKITHPGLNEEKLLYIAKMLEVGKTETVSQTYGLTCTLFGHKLVTTTNEVITHMAYSTYPYCKCEYYSVTTCERCDYSEIELISTEKVGCCVE